jgi:hypothetical protein
MGGTGGGGLKTGGCGQVPLCFADCSFAPMVEGICLPDGTVTCPPNSQPNQWCSSGTGGSTATGGIGGSGAGTGGSTGAGGLVGGGGSPGTGGVGATGGFQGSGGSGTGGTFGGGGAGGAAGSGAAGAAGGHAGSGAPSQHRPTGTICSGALADAGVPRSAWDGGLRDPETSADGGSISCSGTTDVCPTCANGLQSRCLQGYCLCDECNSDQDCANGGVCSCGLTKGFGGASQGNICIPANCRVDSDCGPNGYCSPTVNDGCGAFYGVQGYYCHTPQDQCHNDSDCGTGYCAYSTQGGMWVCATGLCAG